MLSNNFNTVPTELYKKLDILKIKCPKCLDTRVLWKSINISNHISFNKFFGIKEDINYFMIIACDRCSDSRFLDYSKTSNIKIGEIPVFNADTYETDIHFFTSRIPFLRKKCNHL